MLQRNGYRSVCPPLPNTNPPGYLAALIWGMCKTPRLQLGFLPTINPCFHYPIKFRHFIPSCRTLLINQNRTQTDTVRLAPPSPQRLEEIPLGPFGGNCCHSLATGGFGCSTMA